MGKIFAPLKFAFIAFNSMVMILCFVVIAVMIVETIGVLTSPVPIKHHRSGVTGAFVALLNISFLGIYGASSEKPFYLKAFAVLMGIILTLPLIIGCIVIAAKEKFLEYYGNTMELKSQDFGLVVGLCFGLTAAGLMNLTASIFMIKQIQGRNY